MEEIRFDFNNMFSANVSDTHGVTESDISAMEQDINAAARHLQKVIADKGLRVKFSLEWTQLQYQDKAVIDGIKKMSAEIVKKYDSVISLGIGGSYLGVKAAQDALGAPYYNEFSSVRNRRPRIYFEGNNLDPDTLSVLLKNLSPKKTFVVVISKSGETTETKAAFMIVEQWLKKAVGKNYGRQIVAITDPQQGSLRKRITGEQKKDPLSFRNLPLLPGVGGRFSEFNMGLLHLALIGVDINKVFAGMTAMEKRCSNKDVYKNPAYMYALLHFILYRKKGKSLAVMMPFSETLKSTADWYVQLLAESLGKKYARKVVTAANGSEDWLRDKDQVINVGRTPVSCRGTNDLHSIQQNNIEGEHDKVVTFIRAEKFKRDLRISVKGDILSGRKLSELMALAQEATAWALVREARPNCAIIMPEISEYHWGALLYFFEMATAFEGELLNVNAFDQPGVEGYKNYMYYKLGKPGILEEIVADIRDHPLKKDARFIL